MLGLQKDRMVHLRLLHPSSNGLSIMTYPYTKKTLVVCLIAHPPQSSVDNQNYPTVKQICGSAFPNPHNEWFISLTPLLIRSMSRPEYMMKQIPYKTLPFLTMW